MIRMYYDVFMDDITITCYTKHGDYKILGKDNDIYKCNKTLDVKLDINASRTDEYGNHYHDVTLNEYGDIINNIKIDPCDQNIKIMYIISGNMYDHSYMNVLLVGMAQYSEFIIRIIFLKPSANDSCKINFDAYFIPLKILDTSRNNFVYTKNHIYYQGICLPNNRQDINQYQRIL